MQRSKKILILCNCLLNANAKVFPLAQSAGVYKEVVMKHIDSGVGLLQLPCPETVYLGMNRWGMTKEQYDTPSFRKHCRQILEPTLAQIKAFQQAGYEFLSIMGMDGSPNCGINRTCYGFTGGEISATGIVEEQRKKLLFQPGMGVFMEIFAQMLHEAKIDIAFSAIDEESEQK